MDINDSSTSLDFTDTATWNKLLHKSAAHQTPAAFTPTVAARQCAGVGGISLPSAHEKDMFLVMAHPALDAIIAVWESTDDDQTISRRALLI